MQAPVLPFFLPHAFPPSLPPEKQASHNAINTKADCIRSCLAQLLSPSIHRFETILSEAISAFVSVNTNILATTQEKPKYSDGNKRGKAPSNQTSKPATRAASTFSEQPRDRLYHDQQEQRDISLHPLPLPGSPLSPPPKKVHQEVDSPPLPCSQQLQRHRHPGSLSLPSGEARHFAAAETGATPRAALNPAISRANNGAGRKETPTARTTDTCRKPQTANHTRLQQMYPATTAGRQE